MPCFSMLLIMKDLLEQKPCEERALQQAVWQMGSHESAGAQGGGAT